MKDLELAMHFTLQNTLSSSRVLSAPHEESPEQREEVETALQCAEISQKFPLKLLRDFPNLQSLTCRGGLRLRNSPNATGSSELSQMDPNRAGAFLGVFNFSRPLQLIAFQVQRLRYHLTGGQLQDSQLSQLRDLPKLKALRLENLKFVTDRGLEEIGQLTKLQILSLRNCPNILGRGVRQFIHLKNLTAIDLTGQSPLALEQFGALNTLSALSQLQNAQFGPLPPFQLKILSNHRINQKIKQMAVVHADSAAFDHLVNLTQLEKLTLSSFDPCFSATAAVRRIASLRKLRTLELSSSDCPVDVASVLFDTMTMMPRLATLHLTQLAHENLPGLLRLTQLVNLTLLHGPQISASDISSLSRLKYLKLESCAIQQGTGWLSTCPLETLKASRSRFLTPLTITTLRNLPGLKSLDLNGALLPKNFNLHHLADLEQLQTLDLSDYTIFSRSQSLANKPHVKLSVPLPNLTRVSLRGCSVSSEQFDFIAQLPKLEEIDLTRAHFAWADLKKLRDERPMLRIYRSRDATTSEENFWRQILSKVHSILQLCLRSLKTYLLTALNLKT